MKQILLILSLILLITACDTTPGKFEIVGTVAVKDNSSVYRLEADRNNQPVIVDSVKVQDGVFSFKGEALQPDINYIRVEGVNGSFPLIIEAGKIKTTIYKDSLAVSKAKGTVSNDGFMEYKAETKVFINSLNSIGSELQGAIYAQDSLLISDLQDQYRAVQGQIRDYELEYVKSNPDSYISVLILERVLATKAMSNRDLSTYFEALSDRVKDSRSGAMIASQLNAPEPAASLGQPAPLFEGPTPEGNLMKLEAHMGKVTLVEFWASWCRPCRAENPFFVRMYNRLHPKGLEIVAVSLDKEKSKWVQAIEDDGLQWTHVSNLKFWRDPIAQLYGVDAIPNNFILDENGTIVAKSLRGPALEQKLEELLN